VKYNNFYHVSTLETVRLDAQEDGRCVLKLNLCAGMYRFEYLLAESDLAILHAKGEALLSTQQMLTLRISDQMMVRYPDGNCETTFFLGREMFAFLENLIEKEYVSRLREEMGSAQPPPVTSP